MDDGSQKLFDLLVRFRPEQLSEGDLAFLKARESYLSPMEREAFASIFEESKPKKKAEK
jgi:hypothetical protein